MRRKRETEKLEAIMKKMLYRDVPTGTRFIMCPYYWAVDDYGCDRYVQRDFHVNESIYPTMVKQEDYAEFIGVLDYDEPDDECVVYAEVERF